MPETLTISVRYQARLTPHFYSGSMYSSNSTKFLRWLSHWTKWQKFLITRYGNPIQYEDGALPVKEFPL